ncbi:MAG: tRNA pseudouridine(38-40) synthase TruA [Phycisphaerales bacterium]|nr:tRNA pseudouridine(38-40) synthase TruA [Phycisphaerales bacterium]
MLRNIRLVIAYDGTEYHGWQKQPGWSTVQEMVERAARRVARHQVTITGAGRTDAGVHAAGQVANFLTTSVMPCEKLRHAIGSRLPKDISVISADEVALEFRATRDALSKLYRYVIFHGAHRPVEQHRQRFVYHFWNPLDVERMNAGARYFIGQHDFAAYASKGSPRESTVRTVLRAEVSTCYNEIRIDVVGTGFLYHQVRNMVGTLIEVGRGHWPVERVGEILASKDRSNAGPTAPARGLSLQWVCYPPYLLKGAVPVQGHDAPRVVDSASSALMDTTS